MNKKVKESLKYFAYLSGYSHAKIKYRRISGDRKVFIIMYHRVDYKTSPLFEVPISPERFEKHIRYFKKQYLILNLAELNESSYSSNSQKDVVIITFDDGYVDNYTYAFPILKKYNVPATIFLVAGLINTSKLLWYDRLCWILYNSKSTPDKSKLYKLEIPKNIALDLEKLFYYKYGAKTERIKSILAKLKNFDRKDRDYILNKISYICNNNMSINNYRSMLNWQEVREMMGNGIHFGSHTMTHPVLSQLSKEDAKNEIEKSKNTMENELQQSVDTFAYPFGKNEDFTSNIVEIIKTAGYKYACTTIRGIEKYPIENHFLLKRRGAPDSNYMFL